MRLKMVHNHLVLLPGLDGTGHLFAPLLHSPANHFTSTVVSYPCDQLLNYQQLIPRIRAVMPWDQTYTLVAESFAGPLAIQFAAAQHESVKAIVLVACFAKNPIHPLLEWARCLLKDSWLQKPIPEAFLRKYLMGEDCPSALAGAIMESIRSVRPEVLGHRIRMAMDTDVRGLLGAWNKPLLYLEGTRDKIVGKRGLEAIRAVKPEVASVQIDAPHLVLQRRPVESIAAIDKFLQNEELMNPTSQQLQGDLP